MEFLKLVNGWYNTISIPLTDSTTHETIRCLYITYLIIMDGIDIGLIVLGIVGGIIFLGMIWLIFRVLTGRSSITLTRSDGTQTKITAKV